MSANILRMLSAKKISLTSAQFRRSFSTIPPYTGISERENNIYIAHKKGTDLLNDPIFNRGTAFSQDHRERLGLRGLLPPIVQSIEQQETKLVDQFRYGVEKKAPPADSAITEDHIRKWCLLRDLHDRNETLYFKMLVDHFAEMAPIVYTPTVGWACLNYSVIHRRPRGFYFTLRDKGSFSDMLWNIPTTKVDAIVVTDGSRILGLGDLGIQGMGIPIGKLDMYVAAAGFRPDRVLPCILDVGTDNPNLLADPSYMGLRQPRLRGSDYIEIVDEFVSAVMGRWPDAVLQFEDFRTEVANTLLQRYKDHHCIFNDDIQGTAATALAGMYGALRVLNRPPEAITNLKFLVCGAGSAGMGVVEQLTKAIVHKSNGKLTIEDARKNFIIFDQHGVLTHSRPAELNAGFGDYVLPYIRPAGEGYDGLKLPEVVRKVQPDVMLGLTGAGRIWTNAVLTAMGDIKERPIIFPMSNPTGKMECTAQEAQTATGGRAIYASGSPQPPFVKEDGTVVASSQANNVYVFPGLALGASLGKIAGVSDGMLMAAAEAVPDYLPQHLIDQNGVYPGLDKIRELSAYVAVKVMRRAHIEELVTDQKALRKLNTLSDDELLLWVKSKMYVPTYGPIVTLPPGINE